MLSTFSEVLEKLLFEHINDKLQINNKLHALNRISRFLFPEQHVLISMLT